MDVPRKGNVDRNEKHKRENDDKYDVPRKGNVDRNNKKGRGKPSR